MLLQSGCQPIVFPKQLINIQGKSAYPDGRPRPTPCIAMDLAT